MMHFLCKDCWRVYDENAMTALCKRCDEAAKGVSRPDPLSSVMKRAFFGGTDDQLVCRIHGTEPLDVFCPECGTQIPPRALMSDDQSVVAMIGDTASGKTSLLWVLSELLREPAGNRFMIRQALGKSDEQLAAAMKNVLARGYDPTPPDDAATRNYAWELIRNDPDHEMSWIIAFHDAGGERWVNLNETSRAKFPRLFRYLELASAMIFAIDGAFVAEALDTAAGRGIASLKLRNAKRNELAIIDEIARRMAARNREIPIAVVISKADMFWDREEWKGLRHDTTLRADDIHRTVRDLLMKSGRQLLVSSIEKAFAPSRYFAVSAFGQDIPSNIRLEDIRPVRVEEPLLSLLGSMADAGWPPYA